MFDAKAKRLNCSWNIVSDLNKNGKPCLEFEVEILRNNFIEMSFVVNAKMFVQNDRICGVLPGLEILERRYLLKHN